MIGLKCAICESGDLRSSIICLNCISRLEERHETYSDMIRLVLESNNLTLPISTEIEKKVHEKVFPVYELLCEIKLEDE